MHELTRLLIRLHFNGKTPKITLKQQARGNNQIEPVTVSPSSMNSRALISIVKCNSVVILNFVQHKNETEDKFVQFQLVYMHLCKSCW